MLKIYTRYLLREMVVPFCIGQGAIVMMLTGSVLYNNAQVFLQYQIPVVYVIKIALFFIPFLMHMTMPVAMAVAASLAVSRLSKDSEITVLRASGISLTRLFMPIFALGLLVSIGDFLFGEYVVPPMINRYIGVIGEVITNLKNPTPPAGQYLVSSDQQHVLGVQSVIPHKGYLELRGIEIIGGYSYQARTGNPRFLATARSGEFRNGDWKLDHASLITYDIKNPTTGIRTDAEVLHYYIPVDTQSFQQNFVLQLPMGTMANAATRTFAQMGEELRRERAMGQQSDYTTLLDYQFKLSVPFSCLVMALCCPPLALRFGRGGGFMGTLLSICLVFVYWNTLLLSRILGTPGPSGGAPILSPLVAAWSQNVLFVLLGLWVLRKSE